MSKRERKERNKRKREFIKSERPLLWEKCKDRFDLTDEDIERAKELGFVPEKLIHMDKKPKEHWKYPPKQYINKLYVKREEKLNKKKA